MKVAIIYWCQGAGHATRSISVAREFEDRGHEVMMDGGGPGQRFAEMNGYGMDEYSFEEVPVINKSITSVLWRGLTEVVPSAFRRLRSVLSFLKQEEPDVLITDCPVTIFAAALKGQKFYAVNHLRPKYFNLPGRPGAELLEKFTLLEGEKLFLTCLWRDEETEGDIVGVDPLAQEGDGESVEQYDVLLIPGTFGDKFEELGSMLAEHGLEVKIVGGDDWETKKSMTPYTEAADCVVCAGFSSIADAVVPGTPTVVFPKLHMQELLARQIDEKGVKGVETAYSVEEAYEQVQRVLDGKVPAPEFENGSSRVVDVVLDS